MKAAVPPWPRLGPITHEHSWPLCRSMTCLELFGFFGSGERNHSHTFAIHLPSPISFPTAPSVALALRKCPIMRLLRSIAGYLRLSHT